MRGRLRIVTGLLLLLIWPCLTPQGLGQASSGKVRIDKPLKGFKVAEPFESPHETQIKSLLEGGKALPQAAGKTLLFDGVTLRTFNETNAPQLIVKCTECIYNSTTKEVNSAGPIQMQTADGKFAIEGEGFFWRQTNSSLVISNKVHTLIQSGKIPQATNAIPGIADPENGPMVIDSVQFDYDGTTGRGVWRDHVRVTGTNLVLTTDLLTGTVPASTGPTGQRELRSLSAQDNVTVDYHELHATGARLNYAPETGLIRISEQARWRAQQRYGSGDELVLDRSNQIFQVNGHATLHLPGQMMGEAGLLSYSNSAPSKSKKPSKREILIQSHSYEIRTNWAVFRDDAQMYEQVDNINRGKMTCQTMVVTFSGTNELQTITGQKDVVIEEGNKSFTGGHAFYTHTNTTLEMTQQPKWQDGLRSGKGDLLRLNTQKNEMLVQGTASLRLPANELAGQFSSLASSTNAPVKAGTNQFAQIFCEQYLLRPDKSTFKGGVYATHPEMNVTCESMAVEVGTSGLTNVVAQQNVVFDLMNRASKVHGTGDQALYSFGMMNTVTNGTRPINELRLTGTPAALVTTKLAFPNDPVLSRNQLIIFDRLRDKLILPGSNYTIQGTGPAFATNTFVLPKSKLTK